MMGVPAWIFLIAPIVAAGSAALWATVPHRRRDPALRGALIASVGITAIEALVAVLILGVLVLLSLSGGVDDL